MDGSEILVLGATGTTGRRVADRLRAQGVRGRAASRSGAVRSTGRHRGRGHPRATEIIRRAVGRPVRHLGTAEDYRAALGSVGVPAEDIEQQIRAFAALRDLGHAVPTDTVRRVTGRDPRDFVAYAAEAASRGAWRD
ncbi:hypothetical protein [Micromonospora sp. U21]|uniref:hypothetical protein n=1 Tax=Micromonospora sp. U21 TaxID=2824899 RepID=UPI001B36A781|nr:hypothetical protein [Micromonospora sp. U21]MBQ0901352.1 hypothetical protein [Micromonospora sp. U21]